MKTKVNEIPLVGPKGRSEIIKRINELEKQIGGSGSDSGNTKKINLGPTVADVLDMMAEKEYFTIEAIENGTNVYFRNHEDSDGDPVTLSVEVSTDGETWTQKSSSMDNSYKGTIIATLNAGQKLYIRGNNATYGCKDDDDDPNGSSIYGDKDFYAYGNMMSLVDGENALKGIYSTTLGTYTFACFFEGTNVCSHPTKNLILPAKTLPNYAYCKMFYNCSKLKRAPSIYATSPNSYGLNNMFVSCNELEIPPRILYCSFLTMFRNCDKLKKSSIYLNNDISSAQFPNCENVCEIINLGTTISPYASKDWTTVDYYGRMYCPAETGVIYKLPDADVWDDIILPDGWVLKDVEIVYE